MIVEIDRVLHAVNAQTVRHVAKALALREACLIPKNCLAASTRMTTAPSPRKNSKNITNEWQNDSVMDAPARLVDVVPVGNSPVRMTIDHGAQRETGPKVAAVVMARPESVARVVLTNVAARVSAVADQKRSSLAWIRIPTAN
jgi:hypothetical protein